MRFFIREMNEIYAINILNWKYEASQLRKICGNACFS
ncbi:hypothetical protein ACVWXS_001356 [Lysinibacillus sp. TE18511]